MSFAMKQQHELVAILSAGGSLEVSAFAKQQHELVALAGAAKNGGSHLVLTDLAIKQQHELVAIASAGKGHVTLRD